MSLDLSTEEGRRQARRQLLWGDHGYVRLLVSNLHRIGPDMYRSNQPSPARLRRLRDRLGLKTIVNLRGPSPRGHYLLEQEACKDLGLELINFKVWSGLPPAPEMIVRAKVLFHDLRYPALIHCKSGVDRASLVATLYRHLYRGDELPVALAQMSRRYWHNPKGRAAILDMFFAAYMSDAEDEGISFYDWTQTHYDPEKLQLEFKAYRRKSRSLFS